MAKKAESKKAGSKKESTTKKSGDQLPQSGFAKNHELYLITRIDTDLLVKEIQTHYGQSCDVRISFPEKYQECLTVQLFKNKQAKLPVIEVFDEAWADELVAPDLAHFWGVGKIVHISDETQFFGIHEFVYERKLQVLTFNNTTAKECFTHLAKVNSELWGEDRGPKWWTYSQFSFLIYRLLKLGETKFLLDIFSCSDFGLSSLSYPRKVKSQIEMFKFAVSRVMEYLYMVGAGAVNYADYDRQESFDNMFKENGLELKLTDVQRIAALEAMIAQGGGNEFVEAAVSALRNRKRK
jgi:hypothetical protein